MMSAANKDNLQSNWSSLVNDMDSESVLLHLQTESVITNDEAKRIEELRPSERNEAILHVVIRKPNSAFYQFKDALNETNHPHLADLLKSSGNIFSVKINQFSIVIG